MKISERLKNALNDAKKGFARFPASVFSTFLMWLVLIGITLFETDDSEVVFLALVFFSGAVFSAAFSLATEYFGKLNDKFRYVNMICTVIYELVLYGASFVVRDVTFIMAFSGITGICALVSVYFVTACGKKLSASANALKALGFSALVSLVVLVGGSICIGAFIMLVYEFDDAYKMFFLLLEFSLVLGIMTLLSALPKKEDADEPPKKVYKSVLVYAELTVYFVLTAVLYLYLIKLLATRDFPSGGVNPYVTIASVVYIFNLFAVGAYKGKAKLADFFMKAGGILMLPLIAMQSVCLGIRIYHHGLTSARMLSVCFIAITLIFALGSFIKKIGLGKPLVVSSVILFVICATPLNVINVPVWQQSYALEALLERHGMLTENGVEPNPDLDNEAKRQILSCHRYIRRNSDEAPDYLKNPKWKDAYEVFGFDSAYTYPETAENTNYSFYSNKMFGENGFDVSGYTYIYQSHGVEEYDGERYISFVHPDGTERKYDINIISDYLVDKHGYGHHYDTGDGVIPLEDGVDFYYQSVDLEKMDEENKYNYLYISGFFLVK